MPKISLIHIATLRGANKDVMRVKCELWAVRRATQGMKGVEKVVRSDHDPNIIRIIFTGSLGSRTFEVFAEIKDRVERLPEREDLIE